MLIFTDKKSTPAIFKSLSKKYLDKLVFGEVRTSEKELLNKYNVDKYPTLLVLTDADETKADRYSAEYKVD